MKYTIIDGKKKSPFIQQCYDTLEEANVRLEILKAKFADLYPIVVIGIDGEGKFHGPTKSTTETPTPTPTPANKRSRS